MDGSSGSFRASEFPKSVLTVMNVNE